MMDGTPESQTGVTRIEAVSKSWTKASLIIAYVALLLIANVTSLEIQVTGLMTPYATSAFQQHSLVSTVAVIQGVVSAVIKPPMGKIADVFGRLESFTLTIFLYTIGYIQQAASNNVKTFASAQIFWAAGFNGLQILQQIFVADTTDLLNRALYSTLFDVPFLWTVWAGPNVGKNILTSMTWRWGYGIWAIVLPICYVPLAVSLWMNQKKAKRLGYSFPSSLKGHTVFEVFKNLWFDMDIFGLLLLAAAISLILLPLTLAPNADHEWKNPSMIAMIVVGGVTLIAFPFWETSKKLAPKAFFPPNLFRNRTVIAGTLIAFFYFMAFYLSVFPYFYSYLLIVQNKSITTAGNITRVFSFSSTVSSIVVSLVIKYTGHYKYYVTFGSCIYLMGMGIMLCYRNEDATTATLIGTQIAIGVGGGFLNVPVQLGVQASASHQQVAAATTVWLTLLEVGGAVGSAISGAIWSTYIPHKLQQYLPEDMAADYTLIYGDITKSSDYITYPAGSPARIAINRAYQETMRLLLIGALVAAAPIFPLSFFLQNYKLGEMKQPVKGRVIGSSEEQKARRVGRFWRRSTEA
ncbi:MFS general substrate transporter [Dothidotthia symphoricarpi CBS 119687]|uniref:MFS general substrate transporter n=1 Tax=Dothidotthia symphoricarpi CBS 119687 TaxID=1392245 RepID=A0A6A6ALN1_9PLEO|nr:MFS general substrate transporter [Dothidotthia symphoricarpi CBS 119687]KAF2131844.1 MFS general substrate transporter [Dothidotthia symphoricarpi CBS 119687]